MRLASGVVLTIMLSITCARPVAHGSGRQNTYAGTYSDNEHSQLMSRWDDVDMANIAVRRGLLFSKANKPINIHCVECTPGWQESIEKFVQKKYNKDKNLNKPKWSDADITVREITLSNRVEIDISVKFYHAPNKFSGVVQHWLLRQISDVKKA